MKKNWRGTLRFSTVVFILCFLYAIVRYNVFGNVVFDNLPLFVFNKAIAFASIVLISCSYLISIMIRFFPSKIYCESYKAPLALVALAMMLLHAIMSSMLMIPSYFPKLFQAERMNVFGELTIMLGAMSLVFFSIISVSYIPGIVESIETPQRKFMKSLGMWALFLSAGHVFFRSAGAWFKSDWPGNLVPISLLSFIVVTIAFSIRLFYKAEP